LLLKHIRAGRVVRGRRGIYRLVHFPASEHEEMVTAWLWSEQAGVVSHQSALSLHGLSDVLPAQVHLTLPEAWRRRRFRVPAGVVLHHGDVLPEERSWFGPVPATSAGRMLGDCARSGLSPELAGQAALQALRRGLVTKAELGPVEEALEPFGGLGEPEIVIAEDVLGFAGIAPPTPRLYPIETHIAEKLHACTMPRTRPNSRVKGLPDIALLATAQPMGAKRLRAALEQTFAFRMTHALPASGA
jgi:hypothetical protein